MNSFQNESVLNTEEKLGCTVPAGIDDIEGEYVTSKNWMPIF